MAIPTHKSNRDDGDGSYNPGLQTTDKPVTDDNQIYNNFKESIPGDATLDSDSVQFAMDPYERSPLSALCGFNSILQEITVTVSSNTAAPAISHVYKNEVFGPVVLPILGFVAQSNQTTTNTVTITQSGMTYTKVVEIAALPKTDAENGEEELAIGFPDFELEIRGDSAIIGDDLYFVCLSKGRYIVGFDNQGFVRWYVSGGQDQQQNLQLPIFNAQPLADGTWIGTDYHLTNYYNPSAGTDEPDSQREIWKFDMTGRVSGIYYIRDRAHHTLHELAGEKKIIHPSEYFVTRDAAAGPNVTGANNGGSVEDCVAITSLETGYEDFYYDLREILNFARYPRPQDNSVRNTYDWVHINQVYWDDVTNLIVASCRHQGIIGIDRDSGELQFIMSTHDDWDKDEAGQTVTEWSEKLLTPINPNTGVEYNLNDPAEKKEADDNFWNWGQHNVSKIIQSGVPNSSILEFGVFNNSNYRTRDGLNDNDDSVGRLPPENKSRAAKFKIDLDAMTVERTYIYDDVGPEGYSCFVSTAEFRGQNTSQERLLVNFGGIIETKKSDGSTLPATLFPGETDAIDDRDGTQDHFMGKVILQEVDMANNNEVLFDLRLNSSIPKIPAQAPIDLNRSEFFAFRAHKLPLYIGDV